jgi:Putative beta-barrel porin 2
MRRALCLIVIVDVAPAAAQQVIVTPSIGVTQFYDDNVFYRPDGQSDVTTRVSPRVEIVDESSRATWSARYALDADRFNRHPELSTAHARQNASLDGRYNLSRRLVVNGDASFIESQTPVDLSEQTSVTPGRLHAERLSVRSATTYDLEPRTQVTFTYDASSDRLAGGIAILSQTVASGIDRHVSQRSTVRLEYAHQHYAFGTAGVSVSQVVTATWSRDVAPGASVSLRAGPRVTGGQVSPEIAASVRYRLSGTDAALTYTHTTTTLLGLTGVADTHLWTAGFSAEPTRGMRWRAAPSVLHTTQAGLASVVYRVSAGWTCPIGRHFAIDASYDASRQHGNIYSAAAIQTIARNRVLLMLSVMQSAVRGAEASR